MNRVAVVVELLAAIPASFASGKLLIADTKGVVVKAGTSGPYAPPTMLEVTTGLKDGTGKIVSMINPWKFEVSSQAYVAAVGKTVYVGYDTSAGKLVVADPTIANNVGRSGTLSVRLNSITSGLYDTAGLSFSDTVTIVNGDTPTTLYAKLVAVATKITAQLNAKLGVGVVTFTAGVPVLNEASSFLKFDFLPGHLLSVTCDGIFDGTPIGVDAAGATGPFMSGLTGSEVQAMEVEGAVMDGYNAIQGRRPSFDLPNYVMADSSKNYDAILVTTTLPKEYEAPESPTGWDVSFVIYCANTTPGTLGALAQSILDLLAEVKSNHSGMTLAEATLAFAPHA